MCWTHDLGAPDRPFEDLRAVHPVPHRFHPSNQQNNGTPLVPQDRNDFLWRVFLLGRGSEEMKNGLCHIPH